MDAPRPALLTMASYSGTLAAVRSLARAGIPVDVADSSWTAPAQWSTHVRKRLRCPPVADADAFVEWLLRHGEQEPGAVLYPTSDDVAWVLAHHAQALSRHYVLQRPGEDVLLTLLDKARLFAACERARVACPRTWLPADLDALHALAPSLPYPVVVKPRSQVYFRTHVKGAVVDSARALLATAQALAGGHHPKFRRVAPGVDVPLVQEYVPEAAQGIYSVAGFRARGGTAFVARGAVKRLQLPARVGVGLCFEDAPLDPETAAAVERLCAHVGYEGVFEVELIRSARGPLLIDFNPRFYGQMQFDIARGLDLPLLAYASVTGDERTLARLVDAAQVAQGPTAHCNRLALAWLAGLRFAGGDVRGRHSAQWRAWLRAHPEASDPLWARGDPLPVLLGAVELAQDSLRHPRKLLRTMLGRT